MFPGRRGVGQVDTVSSMSQKAGLLLDRKAVWVKGKYPNAHSIKVIPKLLRIQLPLSDDGEMHRTVTVYHISLETVWFSPMILSGDIYETCQMIVKRHLSTLQQQSRTVPTNVWRFLVTLDTLPLTPKSASLTWLVHISRRPRTFTLDRLTRPIEFKRMLLGFRSRCMIPFEQCRYTKPCRIYIMPQPFQTPSSTLLRRRVGTCLAIAEIMYSGIELFNDRVAKSLSEP